MPIFSRMLTVGRMGIRRWLMTGRAAEMIPVLIIQMTFFAK